MNKNIWVFGTIGVVSSLAIVGFFTLNGTFAQAQKSFHNMHRSNSQDQMYAGSEGNCMGQMMGRDVDQNFIVMMIPHHEGAVDMAELALTRAKRPEIKQLAEAIIRDQNREIEQMKTWHKAWYEAEVTDTSSTDAMTHSQPSSSTNGMDMHSMMTNSLEDLENAEDFDREFIRAMIPHHEMAIMMAQMVLNTANKPEIRALAENVIAAQTAEINQMRQWNEAW